MANGLDLPIINPNVPSMVWAVKAYKVLAAIDENSMDFIDYSSKVQPEVTTTKTEVVKSNDSTVSLGSELADKILKAMETGMKDDGRRYTSQLLKEKEAMEIINQILIPALDVVGDKFEKGTIFLPQLILAADVAKECFDEIKNYLADSGDSSESKGKIIVATVKGDIHDIGKNIVSIVLACNNYEVIDLGVMVPADVIVKKAIEEKPDLVCLSGLITPSLGEMVHVTDEMQKAGLSIPIMVGGATTSKLHTAIKIAPHYDYPVIHVLDASQNPLIAAKLLNPDTRDAYIAQLNSEYEALRASMNKKKEILVPLSEARTNRPEIDWASYNPVVPARNGVQVIPYIPLEEIIPYIHWTFFFSAWKLNGRFSEIAQIHGCDACRAAWLAEFSEADRTKASEAMQLYKDAVKLLDRLVEMKAEYCKAVYGFFPANGDGDNIRVGEVLLPVLRQQAKKEEGIYKSLADYVMPVSEGRTDYVGAFVVTAGVGAESLKERFEQEGDTYNSMLLQTLTDRLAEATAEYLHEKVRKEYWGYAPDESLSISDLYKVKYQGIRPAIGYPSLPDQLLNYTLDKLLNMSQIGVRLTENGAMYPTATVSGIYIAHPDSQYFMIGNIDEEQMKDYACRRNLSEAEVKKLLNKNISN